MCLVPDARDLQTHTHVAIAGHNAPVISVAITPDGRRAVSSSCDGVVRLLDLQARMSQLQVRRQSWSERHQCARWLVRVHAAPSERTLLH